MKKATLLFLAALVLPAFADGDLRLLSFNIWGDYFKNPPEERDEQIGRIICRYTPDLVALQEVTPNWWKARLFPQLAEAAYAVIRGDAAYNNYVPLVYNQKRLTLIDSGSELFHPELDGSKGITWGVFQDRTTGDRLIAFSTHYWYKSNGGESDFIRKVNSMQLLNCIATLKKKYPFPVVGGGDFNCRTNSTALQTLRQAGYASAQSVAPEATCASSHHGDPVRDAAGVYRGKVRAKENTPATSIDHLFLEVSCILPLRETVILDQDALDVSDHSPIYLDFTIRR